MLLNFLGSFLISFTLIAEGEPETPTTKTDNNTCWQQVDQTEILTIYERWIDLPDGRQTRERKGVFITDIESSNIVPLVSSADGLKSWMRGVEDSWSLNLDETDNKTVYLLFNVPWPFKNRDLVTEIRMVENQSFNCEEVYFSAKSDLLPEKKNTIRMQSYEACWTLENIPGGKTMVSFSAYSDTEPVAPRWMQDPVTEKLFKQNLMNLYELITYIPGENE